jgi:hypothetical protein
MKLFLSTLILLISMIGHAKSNTDSIILAKPVMCAVSVDTSNSSYNHLYWENTDSNATKFIVYRKHTDSVVFDSIAILLANKYNAFTYVSTNWWATYSFKIQALNDSGKRSELSDEKKPVQFEALEVKDDEVVRLDWSSVEGNIGDSILIWRSDYGKEYVVIKKLPISDTMYFDTLSVAWLIRYRLEVIKTEKCYGRLDSSAAVRIFASSAEVHFGAVISNNIQRLSVYPNPVADNLKFDTSVILENANLEIYNTLGQLVFKNMLTQNELNVSGLSQGIYNFSLMIGGMNYRGKFIKE